jgi:hypothetical protein
MRSIAKIKKSKHLNIIILICKELADKDMFMIYIQDVRKIRNLLG